MPATLFLMYHAILKSEADRGLLPAEDRPYAVSQDHFNEQIALLKEACEVELPKADLTFPGADSQRLQVVFTFDDSWSQHAEVALPLLSEQNWRGAVFLTTDQIGRPGYLNWPQVRSLAYAGWHIGSHGQSHAFLSDLPQAEMEKELSESKRRIEDETGSPVTWLSLPGGRYSEAVLDTAAACGYNAVFGSTPGLWDGTRPVPGLPVQRLPMQQSGPDLKGIVDMPASSLARLAAKARRKALLRRCLGNRLYHRLYTWLGNR